MWARRLPLARLLELYLVVLPVSIEATGKGRSAAGHAQRLKLHSFMELLVLIFYRANPAVSITPAIAAGVGGAWAGEGGRG